MHAVFVFITLVLLCLVSARPCYQGCSFKLCSGRDTIGSGAADTQITGPVCLADGTPVTMIAGTGEAKINGTMKISEYAPAGLKQRFSPMFFKAYNRSIGHETLQQNQGDYLDNMCISLPILTYCTVDANQTIINHVSSATTDCIALRVSL